MERNKILIVDDVEINREILSVMLEDVYPIIEAGNGSEAIRQIEENGDEIAAILLDIMMPGLNGYDVLSYMKEQGLLNVIPVLIISADTTGEAEERCLAMGASDYIHKPFEHDVVRVRVKNTVELFAHKRSLEDAVKEKTAEVEEKNKILERQAAKLQKMNEDIIDVLGSIVEGRSLESGEHVKRVKGFTRILAEKLMKLYPEYGLTQHDVDIIVSASAMHDIGKIAIPDSILLKPGKLTFEEFQCMKTHTTKGCEILDQINNIWDEEYGKTSYDICRHHHERFDGRGYPDGLAGDDIPISAQIVSIADVYDALVSKRCYKDAFAKDEAYNMILNGECGTFSPKLLECFRVSKSEFEELADRYKEDPAKSA